MRALALLLIVLAASTARAELCAWPYDHAGMLVTPAPGATSHQWEVNETLYTTPTPELRIACDATPLVVRVRGLRGTTIGDWGPTREFQCLGLPTTRPMNANDWKPWAEAFLKGLTGCPVDR